MNLDLPSLTDYRIILVHSQDSSKNFEFRTSDQFKNKETKGTENFYEIGKLDSHGFVHEGNTLHFRFCIRKNNYRQKVEMFARENMILKLEKAKMLEEEKKLR